MEYFWDLFFQPMKHGTNTSHVAFIFLFSVHEEIASIFLMVCLRHKVFEVFFPPSNLCFGCNYKNRTELAE